MGRAREKYSIRHAADPVAGKRNIQTLEDLGQDGIYTFWVAAAMTSGTGAFTSHYGSLSVVTFPTAVDRSRNFGLWFPTAWRNGQVKLTSYFNVNNAVGSADVVISHELESFVPGTAGVDTTILDVTQTVTLPTAGTMEMFTVTESQTTPTNRGSAEILGLSVGRDGTSGSDNAAASIHFIGTRIEWRPDLSV